MCALCVDILPVLAKNVSLAQKIYTIHYIQYKYIHIIKTLFIQTSYATVQTSYATVQTVQKVPPKGLIYCSL